MDALMEDERQKGLTGFNLKYLAMVCMLLDHIEYIFGFTGKVPIVLSWIGRISAPIFLFCVIEGFTHTHDKKKYILRIYAISILMGAIRFGFYNVLSGFVRGDGFTPQNAMLSSFFILLVVLSGIYLCSQKRFVLGITAIVVPVILPYVVMWLFQMLQGNVNALFFINLATFTICPLHTAIADGGTATLVAGVAMYLCRKSRPKQVIAFAIVCIPFDIVRVFALVPQVTLSGFIFEYFEWMEIFSIIPMLLYNGERGNGNKKLFYWFYPLHIYILYAISFVVYNFLY